MMPLTTLIVTISIHALREESDVSVAHHNTLFFDFNPRPPRGERLFSLTIPKNGRVFQSTPSARRATKNRCAAASGCKNFNPRPPRGERHYVGYRLASFNEISIHALREESDTGYALYHLGAG